MTDTNELGTLNSTLGNISLGGLISFQPPPPPTLPRQRRKRATTDVIEWTLDGRPIFVGGLGTDETWSARMTAPGGFDAFSGVAAVTPGVRGADQGSLLIGYRSNGDVLAEYELDVPPRIKNQRMRVHGRGLKHKLEVHGSRLLFQSRALDIWVPQHNDPYGFHGDDTIQASAERAALAWIISKNEDIHLNDINGFVAWVQGNHLTRLAWDEYTSGTWPAQAGGEYQITVSTAAGPSGSVTIQFTRTPDTNENPQTRDTGILPSPESEDLVKISVQRKIATTPTGAGQEVLRARNLRLNGIADGDSYLGSEVMTYIGGAVGYDTSELTSSPNNVLPLDWQTGGWDGLADYVASIDDWVWLVEDNRHGNGPVIMYLPWGNKVWDVSTARDVNEDLEVLELFNRVSVPWTTPDGALQVVTIDADLSTDRLIRTGTTNEFVADEISDPQLDDSLPTQVAYNLLNQLADYRVAGTLTLSTVRDESGSHSPYAVDAGDVVNIPDFDLKIPPQRVVGVTYTPDSVRCDIGQDVSASGQIANLSNQRTRTNKGPRGRRR